MAPYRYQEIEHTADLALRVWGEDFLSLLQNAAEGMYDLMGVTVNADSMTRANFIIPADTLEATLVDFLGELLFVAENQGVRCTGFDFEKHQEEILVNANAEKIEDTQRLIKAVTFHNLEVVDSDAGLETIITFDV